jgi:GDP-D-mannose dehydratase
MIKAVITGVAGQDGSFMAEYLLEKDYKVIGVTRRKSVDPCLDNIYNILNHKNFDLVYGDITDITSMQRVLYDYRPHEWYNLASSSHVGQSFGEPISTSQTNAIAVLGQLESIRLISPYTRFYQASTSELFGGINCPKSGYIEESPFHPRSPYGIAKLAAFWYVKNYREAYDIYACNGILHNHSCIDKETPLIIKRNKNIEIINPTDLLSQSTIVISKNMEDSGIEIWDGEDWEKLMYITGTPVDKSNDFNGLVLNTRAGVTQTTNHHNLLDEFGRKCRADSLKIGDKLKIGKYPEINRDINELSTEEAELLGIIAGDGWVHKTKAIAHIGNNSNTIAERIRILWDKVNNSTITIGKLYKKASGGHSRNIKLNNFSDWALAPFVRDMFYNSFFKKKVPIEILNSSIEIKMAFLDGYNQADGLKKIGLNYKFKNFTTNSQELAQGLLFLISQTTKQDYNINIKNRDDKFYFSINLLSDAMKSDEKKEIILQLRKDGCSGHEICRRTGISRCFIRKVLNNEKIIAQHYRFKTRNDIKNKFTKELDFVYDLETSSGKFMVGPGKVIIANSPRRGSDFATRKITRGVASVKLGLQDTLKMGNLKPFRDEGHSKDYVRAMHLMLQQKEPDDFLIATGSGATIEEMFKYVCELANLDFEKVYEKDPKFMRPSDVPFLLGNPTKAREKLGWHPEYNWRDLLKEMYLNDIGQLSL